ncbi:MAG: response regulator [Anaerolineae bacterium]|nr:response regulator [Anaerolineae bacterium]
MANERILVVDDARDIRDFVGRMVLANEGYDVLTAANGQEGFVVARDLQPDLIITDYMMPGMTGLDMLDALKDAELNIPVILMTAEGSEELAVQAMRAGVYDYLIKPFDADTLIHTVGSVLKRYWTSQIRQRLPAHLLEANLKLEKRIREMGTLVNVGKTVTAMLDIQQVLNHVVDTAVSLTGAEEGSLLLVDRSTGEMYIRAARNFDQRTVHTLRLKVNDSLAGQVVQTGQPIVLSGEDLIKINTAYLVKSLIYIPLRIKDEVIGVLSVDNRYTARPTDDHDVQVLSILADFAAIAIDNARLYAETIKERDTLDAILRDTEDHVIVVDAEDKVLFCNPTARRTFNVTMTDFIGKPLKDVIFNAEVLALFSKQALTGRGRRSEITLEGGERVLNAQLTIIEGVGRSAVMQDISHLKQMDRAKSDFVATVSHDLRSPLTSILGYLELLHRSGPLNEAQEKFMENIRGSVHSITALITELLELSRIESGYDVDLEMVDMEQVVRQSIDALSHQLDVKQHTLKANLAPNLPPVHGNLIRLRQLVNNLIGNAIKYTLPGGRVGVSLTQDEGWLILEVSDTGVGISIEDQPYVFDKFYRSERVVGDFEGTGLGLAIVKSIVEQHCGRIWLQSREGKGTTFTVVLPIEPPKA